MELFDELYGAYYACAELMARRAPLSQSEFRTCLEETLSIDGGLDMSQRLTEGRLPMLAAAEGRLISVLEHAPNRPLTRLERAYLRSLCDDPRAALFLGEEGLERARNALGEGERLFFKDDFVSYDRSAPGDKVTDEAYKARFAVLLKALRENTGVRIAYTTPRKVYRTILCKPTALEYSGKDDVFRLRAVDSWGRRLQSNLGRVDGATQAPMPEESADPMPERRADPLLIEVTDDRLGIARFMLEFSYLEKRSEYDEEKGVATVQLWYPKDDETEILIRLLGFGPVLRVLEPAPFVEKMRQRVMQQMECMVHTADQTESTAFHGK